MPRRDNTPGSPLKDGLPGRFWMVGTGKSRGALAGRLRLCALLLGALGASLPARPAAADRLTDAHRQLADLEQRAQTLTSGFRESHAPDPNAPTRRMVEAEKLYKLGNYELAATLCLDVIEQYPQSRSYDDALYLMGEALYKSRDFLSAKRYFQQAADRLQRARKGQVASQRLIEIALRTGDYSDVERHLERLVAIPPAELEPSVPYVRGKYLFFRNRLDDAAAIFQSIPQGHEYYLQSRYFLATVEVKRGELAKAAQIYDDILKVTAEDATDKEIQDLARMAIGRLLYDRGQFDRAKQWYASVPRQSKYFVESMYETAWNSIKANDFKSAYRALDLMLLQSPDSAQAPEMRLLIGNLHLRLSNFYLASNQFTATLADYEPIHAELAAKRQEAAGDPQYFQRLLGKGLDTFDIAAVVPKGALKLVASEPDVAKLLALAEEVKDLSRGIKDSEELLGRLERAMLSGGRVSIFGDLATGRGRATQILNTTIDLRRRFQGDARALAMPHLGAQDKDELERIAGERGILDMELKNLPKTQEAMEERAQTEQNAFDAVGASASQVNVLIQALEAELVAIEQYYIYSKADQKIKPEELVQPVELLRQEIAQERVLLDSLQNNIAEASQQAALAGRSGGEVMDQTVRLAELLRQEQAVLNRARSTLRADEVAYFDSLMGILGRADGIQSMLVSFNKRLVGIADGRLGRIREQISTEKGNLAAASDKLSSVLTEGRDVGGGLAEAMVSRAADRFYDLTVQSDVGLIDVSWGLKESRSDNVSRLINQQMLELQAVDADFKPLLEEEAP